MNNKKIFLKEAKEVRDELVEIARQYPINEHLELRTKIDTLLIIYDQACELVNTCDCKKELEKHRKEANGFIKSIAEMVGIDTDVVGFDGIKLSIDDFEEAIRRLRDEPELNNTPLPSDYDAGILGNNGGGNIDWWQDYIREEIARCNGYWRDYFEEAIKGLSNGDVTILLKGLEHIRKWGDEEQEQWDDPGDCAIDTINQYRYSIR